MPGIPTNSIISCHHRRSKMDHCFTQHQQIVLLDTFLDFSIVLDVKKLSLLAAALLQVVGCLNALSGYYRTRVWFPVPFCAPKENFACNVFSRSSVRSECFCFCPLRAYYWRFSLQINSVWKYTLRSISAVYISIVFCYQYNAKLL